MDPTLASLALGAGALSILSPCNMAMIPSYISIGVASGENSKWSTHRGVAKSVVMSGAAMLGFMSLFASLGLTLALSFRGVINLFPMASILVSIGLLVMGGFMVLDIRNPLMRTASLKMPRKGGTLQFYLLGIMHGAVSLSCTLPIFLMVVSYAAIVSSPSEAAIAMVIYAAGVGLVLTFLSLAATSSRSAIVRVRAGLGPHLAMVAGSLVTATAIYMLMYQLYHLRWMVL